MPIWTIRRRSTLWSVSRSTLNHCRQSIYLQRNSVALARKRNREALGIAPDDSRAKELRTTLERPVVVDVYGGVVRTVAEERIHRRRRSGLGLGFIDGVPGRGAFGEHGGTRGQRGGRRHLGRGVVHPELARRFNRRTRTQGTTGTLPRTSRGSRLPNPAGSAFGAARRHFGGARGLTGFRGAIR